MSAVDQDLRVLGAHAERVQLAGDWNIGAEVLVPPLAPDQDVADQRFAARHVRVGDGLDAPDHLDAPLGDVTPEDLFRVGVVAQVEAYGRRLAERERELREPLQQLQHARDLPIAHLDVPLQRAPPHDVEMVVANHVQDRVGQRRSAGRSVGG